ELGNKFPGRTGTPFVTTAAGCYRGFRRSAMISADEKLKQEIYRMKLKSKVAIITGGGGGIGRAIALRFAKEGAGVLLAGPTEEKIKAVESEIRTSGGRALAVLTDVANEPSVERMVSAALSEFGQIDILVNNAGVAGPTALVPNISRE